MVKNTFSEICHLLWRLFRREIKAYVTHEFSSAHFVEFIGYTTDAEDRVEVMVLAFGCNYDIRWYKNLPNDWKLKSKWVSQIAHGLMAIHETGITRGDLRGENGCSDHRCCARSRLYGQLVSLETLGARVDSRSKLRYVLHRCECLGDPHER
jgi:hypothetical protein